MIPHQSSIPNLSKFHPNPFHCSFFIPFSTQTIYKYAWKIPRHLDLAMLPAVEVVAPNGFPGNLGKNRCDQELPAAGAASALSGSTASGTGFQTGWFQRYYCWWTISCTTKDDDYPILYRVLTCFNHPSWCRISSINSMLVSREGYHL